jgi:SAM-dependent methyltransferase
MREPSRTPAASAASFYERAYSRGPAEAALYSRWRALGAQVKADHVVQLCRLARLSPARTLEVGCGDGALLSELHRRGFGGRLCGAEISAAAAAIASSRPEIESVVRYDGWRLPVRDGEFELGILSHVLEHVADPLRVLGEVARSCQAVLVEVPLEANLSARRPRKRARAEEIGHVHRLGRHDARELASRAGLTIACELEDALPLRQHMFFAGGACARAAAAARWALRAGLHRGAPGVARRLFTVHYAYLCVPGVERGHALSE